MSERQQQHQIAPQNDAAYEQVLGAALHEVGGASSPPDVTASVLERLGPPAHGGARWLTAAVVMLGVAATVWIAVAPAGGSPPADGGEQHAHEAGGTELPELQDPRPPELPPATRVSTLKGVRTDVRNLRLGLASPGVPDLSGAGSLGYLERLEVVLANPLAMVVAMNNPAQHKIPVDIFEPLAECDALHTLVIRNITGWGAGHLEALAEVRTLRRLVLDVPGIQLDADMARAISRTSVVDLDLGKLTLNAEAVTVFGEHGRLTSLTLRDIRTDAAAVMGVMSKIKSLRELRVPGIDHPMLKAMRGEPNAAPVLQPETLRRLPPLRTIDLSMNPLEWQQLEALPKTVRKLELRMSQELSVESVKPLVALPELYDLSISFGLYDTADADPFMAELLTNKLFGRLTLENPTPAVQKALARQVTLSELSVGYTTTPGVDAPPFDLEYVTMLPMLRELNLRVDPRTARTGLTAVDLEPLSRIPKLATLRLRGWPDDLFKKVRGLVGDSVTVVRMP